MAVLLMATLMATGQHRSIGRDRYRNHAKNHAEDNDQTERIKNDLIASILFAFHNRYPSLQLW